MQSPELVLAHTVRTLQRAEKDILRAIRRRLRRDLDTPDWAAVRLADTRALLAEARTILGGVTPTYQTVTGFLETAWRIGIDWSDADIEAAQRALTGGATPFLPAPDVTAVGGTPRSPRQLVALAEDTARAINGLPTQMLRATADAYQGAVADAVARQAAGTASLGDAVKEVVEKLEKRGIRGFVDKAGRQWHADTYARMALRTAYARSANDARLQRYTDRGVTLVQVSDAYNECALCRPWENRVLRVSDEVAAPAGVATAGTVGEAQAAGLQHPNCRHMLTAFIPGLSRTPVTPDPRHEGDLFPPPVTPTR